MLQKLIDELNDSITTFTIADYDMGILKAIDIIKKHEPDFEEAIKKAFNEGSLATYKKEPQNGQAQDYYNQKYKK